MLLLRYAPLQDADALTQSAAVRSLLTQTLQEMQYPCYTLQKTPQGRPFIAQLPCFDFSFAHTASMAVCAIYESNAKNIRIGVDTEPYPPRQNRNINAFAARFFSKCEQAYLENATNPQSAFLTIFTQKEALAKYEGSGLARHLRQTDTMSLDFLKCMGIRFTTLHLHHHIVTLCLPADCTESSIIKECTFSVKT